MLKMDLAEHGPCEKVSWGKSAAFSLKSVLKIGFAKTVGWLLEFDDGNESEIESHERDIL